MLNKNIAIIIPDAVIQDCSAETNIQNVPEAAHIDVDIAISDNIPSNHLNQKRNNGMVCFIRSCEYLIFSVVVISVMIGLGYLFVTFFKLVFNVNSDIYIYEIPVQIVIYFAIGFVIVLLGCCLFNHNKIFKN